jgi:hypothetical protein
MHTPIRRPRKPEKSNRNTKTSNHGTIQSMFWSCILLSLPHSMPVLCLVKRPVDDNGRQRCQ